VIRVEGPARLRLECTVENTSGTSWLDHANGTSAGTTGGNAIGPVRLGYQVFDAETGKLIIDGERATLAATVAPGTKTPVSSHISVPEVPGRYRVVISPVHEQVAWFYDRGAESLAVHVATAHNALSVGQVRRVGRVRRASQRVGQAFLRSFYYPARTVARHRDLIVSMVRRDLQGRYRGSVAGAWWTVAQPLILMSVYYFVFGVVLKAGGRAGSGSFVFYFLCGMLPWLAFSEAVGRSPNVILENTNFVKRVIFPLEILPINVALLGLVTEAFAVIVFLAALLGFGPGIGTAVVYLPLVVIPQILFTVGLCWFLAALGVFIRDTGQVLPLLLTVWFFATPIVYYAESLPAQWLWAFKLNPMYAVVNSYRAIFLLDEMPAPHTVAKLWAVALAVFWAGHSWFYKLKKAFADII